MADNHVQQRAVVARVRRASANAFLISRTLIFPGVLTSQNFPEQYPNNVAKTHIIQVREGNSLSLEFTAFDVELDGTSCIDTVTIIDGNGTTLMAETCGGSSYGNLIVGGQSESSTLPAIVEGTSNVVNLIFASSADYTLTGWNLTWSAVTSAKG